MTLPTNDLKLAVRGLFRSPLFSIVAILSLSLGIGANTAIFTLIDQILLRKLPVKNPEELVMLYQQGPHSGSNMGSRMHSYPIYQEYQKRAEPLSEVIARRLADASVSVDNQTERVEIEMVSGNFFTHARRRPGGGPRLQFAGRRSGLPGPSGRRAELRLLEPPLQSRSRRRRQEDPRQQLPDDHRRRVGGRLCRHRSGALAADARTDSDEAGDRAGVELGAHGRRAYALGAGVRAAQARCTRSNRRRRRCRVCSADSAARDDAAGRKELVAVHPRAVHARPAGHREGRRRLLAACATTSPRR